jgi:hypothetical protein
VWEDTPPLWHKGNTLPGTPVGRPASNILILPSNLPFASLHVTGYCLQQARLAGPISTQHRQYLPLRHFQGNLGEGYDSAVTHF